MKVLMLALLSLLLTGCLKHEFDDFEGEVSVDPVEIVFLDGLDKDFLDTSVRQVNGTFYVRVAIDDVTIQCMAYDPSALYSEEWEDIPKADENRTFDYTYEDIKNCG